MQKTTLIKPGISVKLNTDKLEELRSMLLSKYITRVGILGNKTTRSGKSAAQTNAEIGLRHEKGVYSEHLTRRSFIVDPLMVWERAKLISIRNHLANWFQRGEYTKERLKKIYILLGIHAENIIQAAFESKGFGNWYQNPKTGKGSLIDTGQLRRSITSDVIKK